MPIIDQIRFERGITHMYPLRLEPQVKEIVWGGDWLATKLKRACQPAAKLGESWEAYSGSVVVNGEWAGQKLSDLFGTLGAKWLGQAALHYPKFPLLVKFIDANQNLSIQVHPDDKLAARLENSPFGKTEFWYILEAEPNAAICYGLNALATDRARVAQAISEQNLLECVQQVRVQRGDVVYIPAGTVHALTKGIVAYELQQDCDITYRLYDWGRVGREIHIEKGLQAINYGAKELNIYRPNIAQKDGYTQAQLICCEYFQADLLQVQTQALLQGAVNSFTLLTMLEGNGELCALDNAFETEKLSKGDTLLIPAGLAYYLHNSSEQLEIIRGWLVM